MAKQFTCEEEKKYKSEQLDYLDKIDDDCIYENKVVRIMRYFNNHLVITSKFKSPLEVKFYHKFEYFKKHCIYNYDVYKRYYKKLHGYMPINPLLRPQYKCGKYFIDFAVIRKYCKIAIEVDGFAYHDRDKKQFAYERKRERFIQSEGFIMLRYTNDDLNNGRCLIVNDIMTAISKEEKKIYEGIKK